MYLNKALDDLKNTYDNNKKEYIQNKISKIETAHIQKKPKLAWATIREVSNYKMSHTGTPSGNNPTERIKLWKEHFKNLLGQPAFIPEHAEEIETIIPETLPISTHEFTKEEMTAAIKITSKEKQLNLTTFLEQFVNLALS